MASWKPFGLGEQRPNNYMEIVKAAWDSRRRPRYAYRILSRGVCDGCALGTTGMHDWTLDGVHLCNVRLRLLSLNTMGALDPAVLGDVSALREHSGAELRKLGRIPFPLIRRAGDRGFTRIDWDTALDLVASRIAATTPDRIAAFVTNRGMPNESYYAIGKAMRAMGSPNVDTAARMCHSPSTYGLQEAVGWGATTCSYKDWIGSDLVVFIGANPANNQPVAMKYLHYAVHAGTKVVCVNPHREPGMDRYWIPSVPSSALFGTRITDRFFEVDTGGDLAFLIGTLKHLVSNDWVDHEFVDAHTNGFDALQLGEWDDLERAAGTSRAEMLAFAELIRDARTAVFVWSMGVTQHARGEDTVRAICNLALTGGFVGREHCGLMPIRGHSGVQGGAEMGCYATVLPGHVPVDAEHAAALSAQWGFDVPAHPGLASTEMVDADLDVLLCAGGNLLDVMPDPAYVAGRLARIGLRVHSDLVLSSQMLVDPDDTVLVLPACTRYEIPGGVTETSTERRVIFSPEIEGPRIEEARAEWEIFGALAERVSGVRAFGSTQEIRDEIARTIPFYEGVERLREQGDQFQWGGPLLGADWRFNTADGRARFASVAPPTVDAPPDALRLSTRRGKQFNSMVQERRDAITGAARDEVLVSAADAAARGLGDGAAVLVASEHGELEARIRISPIKPGNVQIHWPEGNVLIDHTVRSAEAHIPDYNAWVRIEPRG